MDLASISQKYTITQAEKVIGILYIFSKLLYIFPHSYPHIFTSLNQTKYQNRIRE